MEEERVSYEALQDLLRTERRGPKLTPLPPRFWSEVRDFLATTMDAFRREQASDPFSRKVMLLTDEVKNARNAARSLWALRERKLAMLALAHTHERQRPQGITPDEGTVYDRLLAVLDEGRAEALADAAPAPAPVPAAPAPAPAPAPPAAAPEAAPPAAPEPAAPGPVPHDTTAKVAMVTIRALGDIPPFVGPDMQTYLLKEGDIATVPPAIAQLLEKRRKAAVVEG